MPSEAIYSMFDTVSKKHVAGPELPRTGIAVRNVPWDQALEAVALVDGCIVQAAAKGLQLSCAPRDKVLPPLAQVYAEPHFDSTPIDLATLRISAIGTLNGSDWATVVEAPDGWSTVISSGRFGGLRDGGRRAGWSGWAMVDEHGVTITAENTGRGHSWRTITTIPFQP